MWVGLACGSLPLPLGDAGRRPKDESAREEEDEARRQKKREEQVKLLERTARTITSRHFDAWRRVVVEERAARALAHREAEIERLTERIRQMGYA